MSEAEVAVEAAKDPPARKPKQPTKTELQFYQTLNQTPRRPPRAGPPTARPERLRASDRARGPPSELTELQLRKVLPLSEVSEFTSPSEDSLKRNHADKVRRLGPRRLGMTVGDMLTIGEETA